jgi:hypothetical protein
MLFDINIVLQNPHHIFSYHAPAGAVSGVGGGTNRVFDKLTKLISNINIS